MLSQQSSFRDMYSYPQKQTHNSRRKYAQTRSRLINSSDSGRAQKQSFYKVVQKAKNVAMFTQTMKQKISQKRTLNQHTLKPQQFQFLQSDSRQQHSRVYFEHNSNIVLAVEVLFVINIFLLLWNNTYELVFQKTNHNHIIQWCSLIAYLLHILFFHLTEYTSEKLELINDRNEILSIYISEKLVKDGIFILALLIQLTPLDEMQHEQWILISTRLISLISYSEVGAVCNKIQDLLSVSIQAEMTIAILKLFFKVVLFLHILSIAFNFLASIQQKFGVEHIWILDNNLQAETSFDKYIIAWYWAATILSTVGFGEITPKNNYERFFVSIIQVFCCMIIGYFVNVIGDLIKMRGESDQKYERQIRSLHRCLKSLSITPQLKHKIRTHYFNKHFISKIHNPKQQKQILQQVAPNLQKNILQQNNIKVLKKNTIFQKFAEQTLMDLTLLMKKVILAPQNVFYSRSSLEKKLWIIENGTVEEFTNNFQSSNLRKRIFTYNQQQSLVGWANFLLQAGYKTLAKAKAFTIAYEIEWQKFEFSLKQHPHSYRKFLQLKHEALEKNRLYINKCVSCDRFTHNAINCPRIHFIRKDTTTLVKQHKNLESFQQKLRKKMKFKRQATKFTWKTKFGNGGLEKQGNFMINNESLRVSNGNNIESLFKNVLFRQSAINLQKKKVPIVTSKRQNKLQAIALRQSQSNDRESCQKSINSCDEVFEREQLLAFDRVFFNQDNGDYMPRSDIQTILPLYSKKMAANH